MRINDKTGDISNNLVLIVEHIKIKCYGSTHTF